MHFPARIQIFHHTDRGGGYSQNQGESPSLPPASVLAGPTSDPGELSANQWKRRCRQRRRLYKPVNGGGQTDHKPGSLQSEPAYYDLFYLQKNGNGEENPRFLRKMENEKFRKFRGTFERTG